MTGHVMVVEDGVLRLECREPVESLCHAVWECGCEEWLDPRIEDGVPLHDTMWEHGDGEGPEVHRGTFDAGSCNSEDWVNDGEVAQVEKTRHEFPVELIWECDLPEWRPVAGGSS